jgi:serine/threonine protein kinase
VFLVDFGISELMTDDSNNNVRCTGMGTPAYMAPEVCRGDDVVDGEAVDTWSLGVTAYFMIYGRLPFQGATVKELHEDVKSAREVAFPADATEDERSFLGALLAKDPQKRSRLRELRGHPFLQVCSDSLNLGMDSPRGAETRKRQSIGELVTDSDVANALTTMSYSSSVSSQSSQVSRSCRESLQLSPTSNALIELGNLGPPLPPPTNGIEQLQRVRNPRQAANNGGRDDETLGSFSALQTELTASFPDTFRVRRSTQKAPE